MAKIHVITPVKDSIETTLQTIDSIMQSEINVSFEYTVYNDYSSEEVTARLQSESEKKGFNLVNIEKLTSKKSPNYLLVLQLSQKKAIEEKAHLIIVESDVIVQNNTLQELYNFASTQDNVGMVAAVTTNAHGEVNFPYLYAKKFKKGIVKTNKRLSFCCSLLSNDFLKAYDFNLLDPKKTWYDVFVSHKSVELGYGNYLHTDLPVLHYPHSSRPWKKYKYTHPVMYYWKKFINNIDKI